MFEYTEERCHRGKFLSTFSAVRKMKGGHRVQQCLGDTYLKARIETGFIIVTEKMNTTTE